MMLLVVVVVCAAMQSIWAFKIHFKLRHIQKLSSTLTVNKRLNWDLPTLRSPLNQESADWM